MFVTWRNGATTFHQRGRTARRTHRGVPGQGVRRHRDRRSVGGLGVAAGESSPPVPQRQGGDGGSRSGRGRAAGRHADVAKSSMVTTWNLGIGLGGLVGGALLAGLGSWSLMIAAVVLLASLCL